MSISCFLDFVGNYCFFDVAKFRSDVTYHCSLRLYAHRAVCLSPVVTKNAERIYATNFVCPEIMATIQASPDMVINANRFSVLGNQYTAFRKSEQDT
jgi:hypothetical protein